MANRVCSMRRAASRPSRPSEPRARAGRFLPRAAGLAACLIASLGVARAAELPRATDALLHKLNLDAAILGDLDKELKVPQSWIDAAAKEGKLIVFGTWEPREFQRLVQPFRERYPGIDFQYSDPVRTDRIIKPIVALQTNHRYLADIIVGLEEGLGQYIQADALEPLTDLPSMADVNDRFKDAGGRWVVTKFRFGCVGTNTDKVAKADLPLTWDDLLTAPVARDGNLALANRPNQWFASLWAVKGEAWGKAYVAQLFSVVKPQLRTENLNAMASLLAAGEFALQVPGYDLRILALKARGAPVDYYCPDPAPGFIQITAMLKGSPRSNAAKIFINWLLSKEGQISHFETSHSVPVDKDLQKMAQFLPAGVQALDSGHVAVLGPQEMSASSGIFEVWNKAWEAAGNQR
jgi:iron(III) transport system substrate-binding protein